MTKSRECETAVSQSRRRWRAGIQARFILPLIAVRRTLGITSWSWSDIELSLPFSKGKICSFRYLRGSGWPFVSLPFLERLTGCKERRKRLSSCIGGGYRHRLSMYRWLILIVSIDIDCQSIDHRSIVPLGSSLHTSTIDIDIRYTCTSTISINHRHIDNRYPWSEDQILSTASVAMIDLCTPL